VSCPAGRRQSARRSQPRPRRESHRSRE